MGKDGEHAEFNMDNQAILRNNWRQDEGAAGLDGQGAGQGGVNNRDYNNLL